MGKREGPLASSRDNSQGVLCKEVASDSKWW